MSTKKENTKFDSLDYIFSVDVDKEKNKVSIFERIDTEYDGACTIKNCKKKVKFYCYLDTCHYCWYHAFIYKQEA